MIDEIVPNAQGATRYISISIAAIAGKRGEPGLKLLVAAGVEVTIDTSPAGTSYITHSKGFVCDDAPVPGRSWRDRFVTQFDSLRDYAWTNERNSQFTPKGTIVGPSAEAGAPVAEKKAPLRRS